MARMWLDLLALVALLAFVSFVTVTLAAWLLLITLGGGA
jgi:hypothetical protein